MVLFWGIGQCLPILGSRVKGSYLQDAFSLKAPEIRKRVQEPKLLISYPKKRKLLEDFEEEFTLKCLKC